MKKTKDMLVVAISSPETHGVATKIKIYDDQELKETLFVVEMTMPNDVIKTKITEQQLVPYGIEIDNNIDQIAHTVAISMTKKPRIKFMDACWQQYFVDAITNIVDDHGGPDEFPKWLIKYYQKPEDRMADVDDE